MTDRQIITRAAELLKAGHLPSGIPAALDEIKKGKEQ